MEQLISFYVCCVFNENFLSMWIVGGLIAVAFCGCGWSLERPGYKRPPDPTVKPPMQQFLESQQKMLDSLRFHFDYLNFRALSGVKQEVLGVIAKNPPRQVGGSPRMLLLHIDGLIDAEFHAFTSSVQFAPHELECARDYSDLCPVGWIDLGDGRTCEAPPALFMNEECRTVVFGGLTPLAKSEAAFKCGESRYPCLNECPVRDYSATCPDGWWPLQGHVCQAPDSYRRPCVFTYDFADHSTKLKKKFEDICKVVWPCKINRGLVRPHT